MSKERREKKKEEENSRLRDKLKTSCGTKDKVKKVKLEQLIENNED